MRTLLAAALTALVIAPALRADGFAINEQSARAAGMGGAYVAQVNDPSAIFYNPGALGILTKKKAASIGASVSAFDQFLFQGLAPGAGAGTTGQQPKTKTIAPQVFLTVPLFSRMTFGLGTYTPFRMHSEWTPSGTFGGRLVAFKSRIDTLDVAPTIGLQLAPSFGIGAGAIYRTTKVSATRDLSTDVAGVSHDIATLNMASDSKAKVTFSAGLSYRPSPSFSFGASYRGGTNTTFSGAGRLTQIATGDPQLDALVKASFPFDQDLALASDVQLPAQLSAGIAFGSKPLLFEADVNRTSWKKLQSVAFTFPNNATLNTSYPLSFKDTTSFRGGIRWAFPTGPQIRLGFASEKSPQPNETVGPFLADASRTSITAGAGLDWLDVALVWSRYASRSITTNVQNVNGNYSGNAWMVMITATK